MKKKLLAAALAACMTFGTAAALPQAAFTDTYLTASASFEEGDFKFEISADSETMVVKYVGSGGDGAFTPTRIGSVPVLKLLDYIEENGFEKVRTMCSRSGGFVSYFGTSDFKKVYALVQKKDPKATLVYEAMIYQICKQIGAMAVVLKGKVDGILLTGGLVIYEDLCDRIRESCHWISAIYAYSGELEQEALALETLKALRGERELMEYDGKPVFDGFDFIDGKE